LYNYLDLNEEFAEGCLKKYPLDNCFSGKFSRLITTKMSDYEYSVFSFSFQEFGTLHIIQIHKIDGFTFINNVGGGLGLFMGLALPNFIEFLRCLIVGSFLVYERHFFVSSTSINKCLKKIFFSEASKIFYILRI